MLTMKSININSEFSVDSVDDRVCRTDSFIDIDSINDGREEWQ